MSTPLRSRQERRAAERARLKERHNADYWIHLTNETEDQEFTEFYAREHYGLTLEEGRARTARMIREVLGDREANLDELLKLVAAWEGKAALQIQQERDEMRRRFMTHKATDGGS